MSDENDIELLEKFVLNNPELDALENLLSQFNIFETLDIVNAEIRHSNVLSWLLNPNANHGLGDFFTKQFLKYLISKNKYYLDPKVSLFDFEIFNYSDIEIRREWQNIDILMILKEEKKRYVVAIENKIKTAEHSDQLQRYREIIEDEFKNYIKIYIYLTPGELRPSDENWIVFSYQIIADLLDDLVQNKKNILNENILNFILNYKIILRRYVVGKSEIEEICTKIYKKHQQALDLIFQYKPDIILELSEYIKANLKKSKDIILDATSKTSIRFTTPVIDKLLKKVGEGWTNTKRILLYEIGIWENRLVLRLYLGPGDQAYRNKLIEFFRKDTSFFKLASRTLGTKWHAVYQKEFLHKRDYENSEPDDLKAKIDKKLSEFMKVDAVKINKYFQDNWKSK